MYSNVINIILWIIQQVLIFSVTTTDRKTNFLISERYNKRLPMLKNRWIHSTLVIQTASDKYISNVGGCPQPRRNAKPAQETRNDQAKPHWKELPSQHVCRCISFTAFVSQSPVASRWCRVYFTLIYMIISYGVMCLYACDVCACVHVLTRIIPKVDCRPSIT